ncbi:MAG: tetratricopeptide repeat protein [Candidatus Riflebacteria bacterium]|nr:tetratricopeptide repeat protein [Candidatus Riflebacteria bacterium]
MNQKSFFPITFFIFQGIFLFCFWIPAAFAFEEDEITSFLKRGEVLYSGRDLKGAEIEFENVLLLDPENVEAQIWLVKVYADLKKIQKAKELFEKVSKIAPNHVKLKGLKELLGGTSPQKSKRKKEPDPVIFETIALLGSSTPARPFGFVIPENKVAKVVIKEPTLDESAVLPDIPDVDPGKKNSGKNAEKTEKGSQKQQPQNSTPKKADSKKTDGQKPPASQTESLPSLEDFHTKDGPLAKAFDEWAINGLPAGLMKYFEMVMENRSLAATDDHNILSEGEKYFQPRFQADQNNEESRFYLGMIAFIGGATEKAKEYLLPLKNTQKPFKKILEPVFLEFENQQTQEENQKLADQKAQEEKIAAAKAAEEAKRRPIQVTNTDTGVLLATPPEGANSSEGFDSEGYDLYKKGRLDEAIEKFKVAIKANPNDSKFQYHMGLAMTDKGLAGSVDSFDRAIEAFNRVIQLEPGSKLAKDAEVMVRDIVAAKNSLK